MRYRMKQSRYKKAAEAFGHAMRLSTQPVDYGLLLDIANCHANLEEYAQAEQYCKEALKLCKAKPIYKLLSTCLIRQNKMSEAVEVFRVALR